MNRISIIIPTRNRPEQLIDALSKLISCGAILSEMEIIVVDDGSDPAVMDRNREICSKFKEKINYIPSAKRGPASARNTGIRAASSNIIFFTGDDILVSPDTLIEHLRFHEKDYPGEEYAMVGAIVWEKSIARNSLHRFLDEAEFQFKKTEGSKNYETDFHNFYSSNLSLKKSFVVKNNIFFDEKFPAAAWEDIEFGYRLEKAGMKIVFNQNAVVEHNHRQELSRLLARMETSGRALRIFLAKWPEVAAIYGYESKDGKLVLKKKFIKRAIRNRFTAGIVEKILAKKNPDDEISGLLAFFAKNTFLYHLHKGFDEGI